MCISTAQARTRWAPWSWLFRRCHFTSVPCSFLSYVMASVAIWDILRNKTSLCVTGRRARFHACGRRGTFLTLLRRWQASVKMIYIYIYMFLEVILHGRRSTGWTWTTFWKGRKSRFVKLWSVVIFGSGHDNDSVWQVQHFGCLGHIFRGMRHVFYTTIKPLLLYFQCSFSVVRTMFCENPTCARPILSWLCAHQARSHCGMVQVLMSLAQPSRDFMGVRSLSLWRSANFDVPRATLSALCACRIALVVTRCSFFDIAHATVSELWACRIALVVTRCSF